jgi:alkylation response protein AidB-like acyl-CoA dehydrogenase
MSPPTRIGPRFDATELGPEEQSLQAEVREFLATELPKGSFRPGLGMNGIADRAFSRKLATRGWVGMALPKRYGGGERGAVDRFIVTEELLRWGAPIGHHWVADRQSGPCINSFGTQEQRERFLPQICRGQLGFSIGMSEPDAGSDLAAVRGRATRVDGGWTLSGTKVWTTGAHRNDWMIALFRTSDEPDRRQGLTQFLVDLTCPELQITPIPFLDGTADFAEVAFRDVFVPETLVLGTVGNGWEQNAAELAFERGGPDRFLSTYAIVEEWLRAGLPRRVLDDRAAVFLGRAVANWWALRQLSLASARAIDAGRSPAVEAALVKELGTRFEQDVIEGVLDVCEIQPSPNSSSRFEQLLSEAIVTAPSFTIRGGTIEVLRSIVAKALAQ